MIVFFIVFHRHFIVLQRGQWCYAARMPQTLDMDISKLSSISWFQ